MEKIRLAQALAARSKIALKAAESFGRRALAAGILLTLSAFSLFGQVSFTEFPLPHGTSAGDITQGPDGALWFTEGSGIGRLTTSGQFSDFSVPGPFPGQIITGPDGALWFTEQRAIGRITTAGALTEYPISLVGIFSIVPGIALGPDGAVWYTKSYDAQIGRITTTGEITECPVPGAASTNGITTGPDGAIWFTDMPGNSIGRMALTFGAGSRSECGVVTLYPLPKSASRPLEIITGPDGALWFTEFVTSRIGRITTQGVITEFTLPDLDYGNNITIGPDGALWFTEYLVSYPQKAKIGRLTTAGLLTEYLTPMASANLGGITRGPDNALWFTEGGGNIVRALIQATNPAVNVSTQVSVSISWQMNPSGWTVLVTNTSSAPIPGPIQVVLTGLPPQSVPNATGVFNASPYLTASTSPLAPGASVSVQVAVSGFRLSPVVYSGTF